MESKKLNIRHALIKDGKVVNIIVWDGREFKPPQDHIVVANATANVGDCYHIETGIFTKGITHENIG